MLIESSKPLTVRLRSGQVHLMPGQPIEFSEEDGLKLLVKAKGRVRLVPAEDITIEPAAPNARPVYFESMDGRFHGPCSVSFMARTGCPGQYEFWLCVQEADRSVWIRDTLLRSKQDVAARHRLTPENAP